MPFQHKKALQNYVPKQIPAENKKGYKTEYIYQGDWYVWDCEPKKLRFFRICSLTTAGLIAGFFLAGALQRTFCNTISFVAVPSLLSIVALMLGTYGLFSPLLRVPRLPVYDFRSMHLMVQAGFAAYTILIFIAAAACFSSIASGRWTSVSRELFTALCYLTCSMLSLTISLRFRRLPCHLADGGRSN